VARVKPKRQKQYKPKRVDSGFVLEMMWGRNDCIANVQEIQHLVDERFELLEQSIDALGRGQSTEKTFSTLIDAVNVAGEATVNGDFPDRKLDILAAKATVEAITETYQATGRFTPRAHELSCIQHFAEVYKAMMLASTTNEWDAAAARVRRMYHKAKQNKPKTEQICNNGRHSTTS